MIRQTLSIILLLLTVGPVRAQYNKVEQRYFAEEDLPMNTPSFQPGVKYMRYEHLMSFLEAAASRSEEITLSNIGKTQQGRIIPVITFKKSDAVDPLRVLYIGGVHGDEPASVEGLCLLIDSLSNGKGISTNIELAIVPMLNIDGYLKQDRHSHNELDINRDFTRYKTPEARALVQFATAFNPQVVIDFHEYSPYRLDLYDLQDQGVVNRFDVMFLYSGNLNVAPQLFSVCEALLVPAARTVLHRHNRATHEYFKTSDERGRIVLDQGSNSPRSTSNAFALTNAVTMLLEVRGVGLGKKTLKRRTHSTYLVAKSVLSTCDKHGVEIKKAVQTAQDMTLQAANPVVVKRTPETLSETIEFIDLRTSEPARLSMTVRNNLNAKQVLTRTRPVAYAISQNVDEVKTILDVLGIEYSMTKSMEPHKAEQYTINQLNRSTRKSEKIKEVHVEVALQMTTVNLPANSLLVKLRQPKGNLLPELFEPDAVNSLVRNNVIQLANNQIPVYRIMQ